LGLTKKKPTIDDVAALSGVGRATVSRVLNGGPNVRQEVRDKVRRAVDALEYKVNIQARFLAGGRTQVLALIYASDLDSEPNSFYHSGLELGALRACTDHGFQLLTQAINQHAQSPTSSVLEMIDARRCDGLVLTPPYSDDLELLQALTDRKVPVVTISPGRQARRIAPGVGIDDEAAGYDLTRYLIALGHRKFGFIKGILGHLSAEERFSGFVRAVSESGGEEDDFISLRGNFTFRSGTELTAKILSAPVRPTALICANDDMAVGALFTAHRMGISIPEQLSVVGFDDTPVSEIIWPPLTTVHQPLKALGYRAFESLLRRIKTGVESPDAPYEVLDHTVIIRESAGKV
jgi:LacI family transcriptional regulator